MARIEIITCDGCGREVEDGAPVSTIAVQDTTEPEGWFTLDLCSAQCVLVALGYVEYDESKVPQEYEELSEGEEGVLDNLPPHLAEEVEQLQLDLQHIEAQRVIPDGMEDGEPDRPLTMEQRMENEKRFKAQAAEISRGMFPVRNKSAGER